MRAFNVAAGYDVRRGRFDAFHGAGSVADIYRKQISTLAKGSAQSAL
jgi:hypothetical protein